MQEREVKLSERTTVVVRELSAFESITADAFASHFSPNGEPGAAALTKTYALCAVRKINGQEVHPLKDDRGFQKVGNEISLGELPKLLEAFVELMGPMEGEALKNESEAVPSA